MINIDERLNITKCSQDWQNMKLELYNVDINQVENVIIKISKDEFNKEYSTIKFYYEDGCVKSFFILDDTISKGEYLYNVIVLFKNNSRKCVISERSYIVYD